MAKLSSASISLRRCSSDTFASGCSCRRALEAVATSANVAAASTYLQRLSSRLAFSSSVVISACCPHEIAVADTLRSWFGILSACCRATSMAQATASALQPSVARIQSLPPDWTARILVDTRTSRRAQTCRREIFRPYTTFAVAHFACAKRCCAVVVRNTEHASFPSLVSASHMRDIPWRDTPPKVLVRSK